MRKFLFLAVALTASPALAAGNILDDPSFGGGTRYDRCLRFVDRNARAAYEAASAWQTDGGGSPAGHCAALALVGLKRYAEAATRLDTLGRDASSGDLVIRSRILDQAGNAWLLAGKGDLAAAAFTRALSYSINDPDILADRAQARALNHDWSGAEADLSSALATNANRVDLLILRASARHALGKAQDARADINHAIQIKPNDVNALLERGNMKYEDGDLAGARADWQQVVTIAPASDAASEAGDHLSALTK